MLEALDVGIEEVRSVIENAHVALAKLSKFKTNVAARLEKGKPPTKKVLAALSKLANECSAELAEDELVLYFVKRAADFQNGMESDIMRQTEQILALV